MTIATMHNTTVEARRRTGRRTLWLIFLVCLAPVLASYAAFYLWRPQALANQGQLVEPPLPVQWPATQAEALHGKWVLVVAMPAACDAACEQSLYLTRQVRTLQAKEMHRVARVAVVAGDDAGAASPDTELIRVHDAALAAQIGMGRVAVVDPLGNLVLRYNEPLDGKALNKDLSRLLKYSSLGK
ncbi:hypothetical protein ACDA63_09875 [Uliginosibacterium sp. sgz301328]|uniref:hypothetical protein n=1 Tax=Uliginosibacterium sp. sgz301328 TaxID=3243764 RepID=UPI00359E03F8